MTRVTNNDTEQTTGTNAGNNNAGQAPGAASKENFGRQANKGILADQVAQELNVPRRTAAKVLDAVLDSVRDLLRTRGKVAVKGFGTFERRLRKGRAYKHPLTGESIEVKYKKTVIFKASDQLIEDAHSEAPLPKRNSELKTNPDDILFKG